MIYRNRKMLEAVRELPCQRCGAQDGTVCGAHRNESKGIGLKTHDLVAALCSACHREIDQGKSMTRDERRKAWDDAFYLTMVAVFERGIAMVHKA